MQLTALIQQPLVQAVQSIFKKQWAPVKPVHLPSSPPAPVEVVPEMSLSSPVSSISAGTTPDALLPHHVDNEMDTKEEYIEGKLEPELSRVTVQIQLKRGRRIYRVVSKRDAWQHRFWSKAENRGLKQWNIKKLLLMGAHKDLIGRDVVVWWRLDGAFYPGIIDCYDKDLKRHIILYEDGQTESLDLTKELVLFPEDLARDSMAPVIPPQTLRRLARQGGTKKLQSFEPWYVRPEYVSVRTPDAVHLNSWELNGEPPPPSPYELAEKRSRKKRERQTLREVEREQQPVEGTGGAEASSSTPRCSTAPSAGKQPTKCEKQTAYKSSLGLNPTKKRSGKGSTSSVLTFDDVTIFVDDISREGNLLTPQGDPLPLDDALREQGIKLDRPPPLLKNGGKRWSCLVCGSIWKYKSSLLRHLNVHRKERDKTLQKQQQNNARSTSSSFAQKKLQRGQTQPWQGQATHHVVPVQRQHAAFLGVSTGGGHLHVPDTPPEYGGADPFADAFPTAASSPLSLSTTPELEDDQPEQIYPQFLKLEEERERQRQLQMAHNTPMHAASDSQRHSVAMPWVGQQHQLCQPDSMSQHSGLDYMVDDSQHYDHGYHYQHPHHHLHHHQQQQKQHHQQRGLKRKAAESNDGPAKQPCIMTSGAVQPRGGNAYHQQRKPQQQQQQLRSQAVW